MQNRIILATDNFTQANGLLNTDWTLTSSIAFTERPQVISHVVGEGDDASSAYYSAVSFPANGKQWAQINVVTTGDDDSMQLLLFVDPAGVDGCYYATVSQSLGLEIGFYTDGTISTLHPLLNQPISYATGDVLLFEKAIAATETLNFYQNGVIVAHVDDNRFESGAPGITFSDGAIPPARGFTHFTAGTLS